MGRRSELFTPVLTIIRGFSLRTGLTLFLGAAFYGLGQRYVSLPPTVEPWLLVFLGLTVGLSAADDRRLLRLRSGVPLGLALAWPVLLLTVSIFTTPNTHLHDELLLTEVALDGLVVGVNPYDRTYDGTIVDDWFGHASQLGYANGVYPGRDHYVYAPGLLLISLPVYGSVRLFGDWYDQRLVYLLVYILLLLVAARSVARQPHGEALTIAFGLGPWFASLFIGFNDVVVSTLLIMAGFALARRSWLAGPLLGLALATKQSAALSVPFFAPLFFLIGGRRWGIRSLLGAAAIVGLTVVPFVLWSPQAIIDDTIGFFFGRDYPISGEGFSELLRLTGVVGRDQVFPFWLTAAIAGGAAALFGWRRVVRRRTASAGLVATAATVAAVWFFSRYFHPHHFDATMILLTGGLLVGAIERPHDATRLDHPSDLQRSGKSAGDHPAAGGA